jgi:hypothetical protein
MGDYLLNRRKRKNVLFVSFELQGLETPGPFKRVQGQGSESDVFTNDVTCAMIMIMLIIA